MRNRIIFFSGGLSSFAVAHHVKINFPDDNIVLYFTDTLWEDEDLYRFIEEASSKLKLPLLKHSLGIDPVQLMIKQHALFNSRIGNCSLFLKMRLSRRYIRTKKAPELEEWSNKEFLMDDNFLDNPVLYFGISFDEIHRVKGIRKNWDEFDLSFPLTSNYYDYDELLALYGIAKPSLYLKGFVHNNCKGRCIKAGKKHFRHLYKEDPKSFIELAHIERVMSDYVQAWHLNKNKDDMQESLELNEAEMLKWHSSNYCYQPKLIGVDDSLPKPTILKDVYIDTLVELLEQPDEDYGGCGCFVEYDENTERSDV